MAEIFFLVADDIVSALCGISLFRPWCYVAQKRCTAAVDSYSSRSKSLPVQIEWKPFMIDPGTKLDGEDYAAYCRRRWGGDGWTQSLRRDGKKVGANFADWKWWPNTLKAHQLVSYFVKRNPGQDDTTNRSNQALFQALYEEGENISSIDTLVKIAVEKLDFPPGEQEDLKIFLAKDEAAEEVQQEIAEGRQKYKISGVPFFVIGTNPNEPGARPYGFSGAQKEKAFLDIFEELEG